MHVVKRDGRSEICHFDKITKRISSLCEGLDPAVDPVIIAQKVVQGVYPGDYHLFGYVLFVSQNFLFM